MLCKRQTLVNVLYKQNDISDPNSRILRQNNVKIFSRFLQLSGLNVFI